MTSSRLLSPSTWSLRARLVAAFALILVLGLAGAGVTVAMILRDQLLGQIDETLSETAQDIADRPVADLLRTNGEQALPSRYVLSIAVHGEAPVTVVQHSTSSSLGRPLNTDRQFAGPTTIPGTNAEVPWRAISVPVNQGVGGPQVGTLTLAAPLGEVVTTLSRTTRFLVYTSVMLVVGGALLASAVVLRELRGLRRIEQTAGRIAAGDLTQRVPDAPVGTEIGSLSHSLNVMLTRIERAFADRAASEARMRRFVADASHELRTPLATVRGYAELHRMGGVPEDEVPAAMARIESEAARMGSLVEDLLTLARLDDERPLVLAQVDIRQLAADGARDLTALDPTREVSVEVLDGSQGPTMVRADADQIRQVVANLVGNAVRYTPAGSPVELVVGRLDVEPDPPPGAPESDADVEGAVVVLQVRDHGPGIPVDEAAKVFGRFYRIDRSRTRASGGSGLGLAIVASVAAAHRGSAAVRQTEGGGATMEVVLPVGGPDGAAADGAARRRWPRANRQLAE